ncbi:MULTISPECIES: MarR family transcriptional regulator [unclassified Methanobrevibacter]|uniref:MarR family winged helix-turn-helix transcriptional regulator n=1 Tax=unclassified Methanobrevibacter TaxID=2638681 RepID=UPI0027368DF6|nr:MULTISPECIES: MarR family transcriptional regulator [unclassified Methanobrevibacter]
MSLEEFKIIDPSNLPVGKLIAIIEKNQVLYLNRQLERFNINSSQLHFLFEISHQKEINQDKIASRCTIDKGTVARSVKKLEDNDLVKREVDEKNRRQKKVSLTNKGEETLNQAIKLLNELEKTVYDNSYIETEDFKKALKEIAIKAIELNDKGE